MARLVECVACGKEKPYKAKEMCKSCYDKQLPKRLGECVVCKEEKAYYAREMCRSCYDKQLPQKLITCVTCKEEKLFYAKEMCRSCHNKQNLIKCVGCGEEKPHKAKEMCCSCLYTANREHNINNARRWAQNNKDKRCGYIAKRKAIKLNQTPDWLTEDHLKQIDEVYKESSRLTEETDSKHHVDHIFPLQGKKERGLHVPWNLQILTESENTSKHNKSPEEHYGKDKYSYTVVNGLIFLDNQPMPGYPIAVLPGILINNLEGEDNDKATRRERPTRPSEEVRVGKQRA
jgi:hypothetical protein